MKSHAGMGSYRVSCIHSLSLQDRYEISNRYKIFLLTSFDHNVNKFSIVLNILLLEWNAHQVILQNVYRYLLIFSDFAVVSQIMK